MWPFRRREQVLYLGELEKIEWKPGDIGVLTYPGRLSQEAVARIKASFEAALPGHRCLVLEEGMRMSVLTEKPNGAP